MYIKIKAVINVYKNKKKNKIDHRRVPDCFMMSATSRQASSLADIFLHACTLLSYSTGRRSISPIKFRSSMLSSSSSSPGRRRRRFFCRRAMVIVSDRLWSVVVLAPNSRCGHSRCIVVVRPNDARTTCAGLCYCRSRQRQRRRRRRRRRPPRPRRRRRQR